MRVSARAHRCPSLARWRRAGGRASGELAAERLADERAVRLAAVPFRHLGEHVQREGLGGRQHDAHQEAAQQACGRPVGCALPGGHGPLAVAGEARQAKGGVSTCFSEGVGQREYAGANAGVAEREDGGERGRPLRIRADDDLRACPLARNILNDYSCDRLALWPRPLSLHARSIGLMVPGHTAAAKADYRSEVDNLHPCLMQ